MTSLDIATSDAILATDTYTLIRSDPTLEARIAAGVIPRRA